MYCADGFGVVGVCESDMCYGDCACGMCGKHSYAIVHVCKRAGVRGLYGWLM